MIYLGWILVATEPGQILYINHYSVPFWQFFSSPGTNFLGEVLSYPWRRRRCRRRCRRQFQVKVSVY